MKSRLSFFQSLIHLFFPHTCCGCGTDLLTEPGLFCIYCQAAMPYTRFEFFCDNPVEKIFWGRADIQAAAALLYFTAGSSVQQSLHLLKYKGRKDIGVYFGKQIGQALIHSQRFRDCELIIPLPLFSSREKNRGYNQAALIAEGISQRLQIPAAMDIVRRIKKTETQTHKSRAQRWKNMESTFDVRDPVSIAGMHVLLVDDVITTGATLEACARTLLAIPGVRLSIACLAHTVSA